MLSRASPPCPRAPDGRSSSRSSDSAAVSTAATGGLFAASAFFAWARVVEAGLASAMAGAGLAEEGAALAVEGAGSGAFKAANTLQLS